MKITSNMNKVYKENRNSKVGRDEGSHIVYHIYIPGKHRGIHQGYVGFSCLTIEGVRKRYHEELKEAFSKDHTREIRKVHKKLNYYKNEVRFKVVASGLTEDGARQLEKALRPSRKGIFDSIYNWNDKAGG